MTIRFRPRAFRVAFLLVVVSISAHGDQLLAPVLTGDVAATLPRGRWMATMTGFGLDVSTRFDGAGNREPISNLFTREVAWNEVIDADPERSAQVRGLLGSRGTLGEGSAGRYRGEFRGSVTGKVPVVGYGVTDRLGVFAALPILDVRVRSRVVYEASPSAEALVRSFRESGQTATASDFARVLDDGFATELRKAGYDYEESRDRNEIGDLRFEVPYVIRPKSRGRAAAVYSTLILPTGKAADPREFYGISTGQERVQLGSRAVFAQDWRRLTFTQSGGVLYPFAAARSVRVPRDPLDRLSPDIDEGARVSGGLNYTLAFDTRFAVTRTWALRSGFQHQRRFRDSFSGSRYSADRYGYVSGSAGERLESAFLHLEADSLASFLSGEFPVPGRVVGGIGAPLSGKNALADRIAFVQANLFF